MANPTATEAFTISDDFHQLAQNIGAYIQANKDTLSDAARNQLYDEQTELLRLSGKINIIGVNLVFGDVQQTLDALNTITGSISNDITQLGKIQNAIKIASCLVDLGMAIILRNPDLIVTKTIATGSAIGIKL